MNRVFGGLMAAMVVVVLAAPAWAQLGPDGPGDEMDVKPPPPGPAEIAATRAFEENKAKFKDDPDVFVRMGLLANRKEKWVKLWGRATGVGHGEAVEFFVVPRTSGKDYESLAVTFARASDVHGALEFIGMKAGRPVNPSKDRYWPKGERVIMTFAWDEPAPEEKPGQPVARKVRAEDLLIDLQAKKEPLPHEGFLFVGAFWMEPEDGGEKQYAADVADSQAVASDYNEPATVLDVPRRAPQAEVYDTLKLNPRHRFSAGQPVEIMLEPERKDGSVRVRDLTLEVMMVEGKGAAAAKYRLLDGEGKMLNAEPALKNVLAEFQGMFEARLDPYVTVKLEGKATVGQVRELYDLLGMMDNEKGIRVEAPPEGHLYYRAFHPDPELRDRTKRLGKPWELHVKPAGEGKITGTLILPADNLNDNDGRGDLSFEAEGPEKMAKVLAEESTRWSQSVLIFTPKEVGYEELMRFIRPSMKTHGPMFVFLPEEGKKP